MNVDIWQRWTVGIGHDQPPRGAAADFRYGSKADLTTLERDFRYTHRSRHRWSPLACLKSAMVRHVTIMT